MSIKRKLRGERDDARNALRKVFALLTDDWYGDPRAAVRECEIALHLPEREPDPCPYGGDPLIPEEKA
jgi:hypothetical protein